MSVARWPSQKSSFWASVLYYIISSSNTFHKVSTFNKNYETIVKINNPNLGYIIQRQTLKKII